jgi:hypothetical protein
MIREKTFGVLQSCLDPEASSLSTAQSPNQGHNLDIIVVRILNDQPPNLTLNSHDQSDNKELYLVAIVSVILQLSVLVYSGCATYYPTLVFLTNGRFVAGFAFPCTAAH